jgi:2-methylcitrate dehydratase PrpD
MEVCAASALTLGEGLLCCAARRSRVTSTALESAPRESTGIARTLADFAHELSPSAIPAAIRERAKELILDAVGVALASTRYDFARRTLAAMSGFGSDPRGVPVIGSPVRLSARDAALVNGVLVHGLDFDDTHTAGVVHATASSFPCALSAACLHGAHGRDLLAAYVLGVEVAARLGAVARGGFHQVGFHPTGVAGAFACALLAGKLGGLDAERLVSAQGIALSVASGSFEFLASGAWTKRLHPGWAAASGITVAALAEHGFVGPPEPYEGRFGLYASYLGPLRAQCDPALATAGLGSTWELANVAVKPYPACHFVHACADAARALARAHGLRAEDVAHVRALVPREVVQTVCEPVAAKRSPQNSYEAQFSIPYAIATSLVRGRLGLAELEDDAVRDPATRALMERIDYEVDPASGFPATYSGALVVRTRDGRTLEHREQANRGCAERPLTGDEITAKFLDNAMPVVGARRAAALRDEILALDRIAAARLAEALAVAAAD